MDHSALVNWVWNYFTSELRSAPKAGGKGGAQAQNASNEATTPDQAAGSPSVASAPSGASARSLMDHLSGPIMLSSAHAAFLYP